MLRLSQNCFSCKFSAALAFAWTCSWQSSGLWKCEAQENPDDMTTKSPNLSNSHPLAVSIAVFHREEKSPSVCVSCCCLVYNSAALWVLPLGFWHFEEEEKKSCLVSLSSVCVHKMSLPLDDSNLQYRLATTKLTQAGFPLWRFPFQAYPSQMTVIQQDFDRTGLELWILACKFPAPGDNGREENIGNCVVGYEHKPSLPLWGVCSRAVSKSLPLSNK